MNISPRSTHITLLIPIILHLFGICLLVHSTFPCTSYTLKLMFINLSFAEIITCSFGSMQELIPQYEHLFWNLQYAFGHSLMYLVMISVTLGRFFQVYLNIRFPLFWNNSRTKKLLASIWCFNVILFVIFWRTGVDKGLVDIVMFPFLDISFLITSTVTYTYIYSKIRRNKRNRVRGSFTGNEACSGKTIRREYYRFSRQFIVIFFLVFSFAIFTLPPDIVWVIKILGAGSFPWEINLLYVVSYVSDFFIYTFGSRPVQRTFRRLFRRRSTSI